MRRLVISCEIQRRTTLLLMAEQPVSETRRPIPNSGGRRATVDCPTRCVATSLLGEAPTRNVRPAGSAEARRRSTGSGGCARSLHARRWRLGRAGIWREPSLAHAISTSPASGRPVDLLYEVINLPVVHADATGLDPGRPRRFKYFCQLLDEELRLEIYRRTSHKFLIGCDPRRN